MARPVKYKFSEINVGESFLIQWVRKRFMDKPTNYHAVRMARWRAEKTGKLFYSEFHNDGNMGCCKITRIK